VIPRLASFAALFFVAACCCKPQPVQPPPPPPPPFIRTTIAVLPFDNATASVDAPVLFREAIQARVAKKGYIPQPMADVDRVLGAMGIQLGGQIQAVDPKELRAKLGADLALSGKVIEASAFTTGIYNRRKVEAELILTDLRTSAVVWKGRRNFVGGEGDDKVIGGLITGIAKNKMREEHAALAEIMVAGMPWCPREAPPAPPPTPLPPAPAPTP